MQRVNFSSGSKWEPLIGYSRAVKIGPHISVSGTTGTVNGEVAKGDIYKQTVDAIQIIEAALLEAGATLNDVVRTRIYVTDISQWEAVGRAHGEFFGEIRPATSMVEVSKLIGDDILVEVEADAIVSE
jgi:enamine deaminase RidA (YjgF/YER057c/UK114 family)